MNFEERIELLDKKVADLEKQLLLHENYITSLKDANFVLLKQIDEQFKAITLAFAVMSQKSNNL